MTRDELHAQRAQRLRRVLRLVYVDEQRIRGCEALEAHIAAAAVALDRGSPGEAADEITAAIGELEDAPPTLAGARVIRSELWGVRIMAGAVCDEDL